MWHNWIALCRAWVKTHEIYDKLKAELKKREASNGHRPASRDRQQHHGNSRHLERDRDRDRDRHKREHDRYPARTISSV